MGTLDYKKLEDVGKWKRYWWGLEWKLKHKEVKKILSKIEINEVDTTRRAGITTGILSVLAGLSGTTVPPIAIAGVLGAISAWGIGSFKLFKSRIKDADRGKGVIIHFPLKYFNSTIGSENIYEIYTR